MCIRSAARRWRPLVRLVVVVAAAAALSLPEGGTSAEAPASELAQAAHRAPEEQRMRGTGSPRQLSAVGDSPLAVEGLIERVEAPYAESRPDTAAGPSRPPVDGDPEPPEPTAAEVAIEAAHNQRGKPYCWGGTGPACFDCSGLTSHAYREAGVELPRTSRAQYARLPRVPLEELRPGDLVFAGAGRVGHVGIYIGEGRMVHAPRSGRHIEVAPVRDNLIGAARPAP